MRDVGPLDIDQWRPGDRFLHKRASGHPHWHEVVVIGRARRSDMLAFKARCVSGVCDRRY
jgi:hypothetical protein